MDLRPCFHRLQVIGSDPLERQVRSLKPQLHVFGHTHIPIDMEVQGERGETE